MSIFEEIIGEVLFHFIWKKIILTFFILSGAALRIIFNFKKLPRQEILDKDDNGLIGFLFWSILITISLLLILK